MAGAACPYLHATVLYELPTSQFVVYWRDRLTEIGPRGKPVDGGIRGVDDAAPAARAWYEQATARARLEGRKTRRMENG